MNIELPPDAQKSNEECFNEIEALLSEGWKLEGSVFEKDQTYRLVVVKEGEEDKIFHTTKPYPKIIDNSGRAWDIP